MLTNRTADQPSRFTVQAADDLGNPIVATTAGWELFDERGTSITSGTVAGYAGGAVTFDVAAEHLTLADGETSSGRELVVTLDTAEGDIEIRDYFIVVSRNPLAIAQNSFVTYPEALRFRAEFGSLNGWDANARDRHMSALAEAYRRLCRMSFKVPGANMDGTNVNKANYGTGTDSGWAWGSRVRVSTLDQAGFEALPPKFQHAIKRAQLAEADVILGGDPIGDRRKAGMISETIGESSGFFQSRPYLNLPISRQAYEEVKRYVYLSIGVLRG